MYVMNVSTAMRTCIARQMQQQYEDWADEFGGSYELFLFGVRRVIVVDPAESRRILALRPAKFGRGPSAVSVSAREASRRWTLS